MFEKHKEKKAEAAYEEARQQWQAEHDELSAVLQAARTGQGSASNDVILKRGEAVFATVSNASLVEDRRGAGRYAGGSQGVSIPIGSLGGRSVRYRVGASRGHFVQGELHPEAVDTGTLVITNQRIVFVGSKKAIECAFAKLVSVNVGGGDILLSVSNRQTVTRVHFGSKLDGWVHLRVTLALAVANGQREQLAQQLQAQLDELDAKRPVPPSPVHP